MIKNLWKENRKMNRDSVIYKFRRKYQVLVRYVLPLDMLSKIYYRIVMRKKLDLRNPNTFNEMIQWMKLYYCPKNQLITKCSDKYEVRQYVKDKGLEHILVKNIGSWLNAIEINWGRLSENLARQSSANI